MIYLIAPQKGTKRKDSISAPVGLCYIQSYLLSKSINSKVIDLEITSKEELIKNFQKDKPNIVGISCFTDNRHFAFNIAKLLKEIDPNIKIVLGAHHASAMYKQVLENYPVDYVVVGEGELTFYKLVTETLEKVKGVAYKKGKTIVFNGFRELIKNLDSLPFPSYKDLDIKKYKWEYNGNLIPNYDLVTSRGCPFACIYCSSSSFWGHKWRFRSPKNIVDEIELVNKKYKIKHFRIVDDNFTINKKRAIQTCKEIIKRKLKIHFWIQSRVQSLANEPELAKWLKKAGCYFIAFGIESGSQKILDNINKKQTVQQIIDACKICKEIGLKINAYFMVGNPGENSETINDSKKIIKQICPDEIGISLTQVYPDTELYKQTKICDDYYWLTKKRPPNNTTEHSLFKLRYWQVKLLLTQKGWL